MAQSSRLGIDWSASGATEAPFKHHIQPGNLHRTKRKSPHATSSYPAFTTYLAWSFTHVLGGTFKRRKQEYKHHDYPILAPLPAQGTRQTPLEGDDVAGPFIYFLVDQGGEVQYVGKSKEKNVLMRWSRPGDGGPANRYWTHSTSSGGCVFNIAADLQSGGGPFHLRFVPLSELRSRCSAALGIDPALSEEETLEKAEQSLIGTLKPRWNGGPKRCAQ